MSLPQSNALSAEEGILVTFIEDKCIYGQLTKFPKHLLWQIHLEILASLPGKPAIEFETLEPGMHVAANVEDMFVRAVVLEVFSSQHVLVYLLDLGTKELVHSYEIRALGEEVERHARMAVRVVLRKAASVATGEVRKLTEMQIIAVNGEVHLLGTLLDNKTPERREYSIVPAFSADNEESYGQSGGDNLATGTRAPADRETLQTATLEPENHETLPAATTAPAERETLPAATTASADHETLLAAIRAPESPAETIQSVETAPEQLVPAPQTIVPAKEYKVQDPKQSGVPAALPLGACQIEVVAVPNRRTAAVRRADTATALLALENKLQSFSLKYRPISNLNAGDYVLALYGDQEHCWSRALIHEVGEESVDVEYIDWAEFASVPKSNIRELPRCFAVQPAYVTTVNFDVEVGIGQKYNAVITSKLDSHGRLFMGYITEQIHAEQNAAMLH